MTKMLSKNFTAEELYCPCLDCRRNGQRVKINQEVVNLLQEMRDIFREPIYVMVGGGVRCKSYNDRISGYPQSLHTKGLAADVSLTNTSGTIENMLKLAFVASVVGFTRVGIYPFTYSKFIHVDLAKQFKSASWIRDSNGVYHYYDTLVDSVYALAKGEVR